MSPRTLKETVILGKPSRMESFRLAEAIFDLLVIKESRITLTEDSDPEELEKLSLKERMILAVQGELLGFELNIHSEKEPIMKMLEGTHLEGHDGCVSAALDMMSEAIKVEEGQSDPIFILADYIHGHAVETAAKQHSSKPAGDMVASSNDKTIH